VGKTLSFRDRYILYGRRVAEEYFARGAGAELLEKIVLLDSPALPSSLPFASSLPKNLIRRLDRDELNRRFPEINHQGIVLVFQRGRGPHENQPDWRKFVKEKNGMLLLLDEIQDPRNLGGIIRSAEFLGAGGVFLSGRGAGLTPAVDRAASGASFHLPIMGPLNAQRLLDAARRAGYWIVASEPAGSDSKTKGTKREPLALTVPALEKLPAPDEILLCIGSEGEGLRRLTLENSDFTIQIPARGKTPSLNAGSAAAILIDRIINR